MSVLRVPVPESYRTPPFPSLYWLIGPPGVVQPKYLYHISDIWRFTLYWTLIAYEAAHLAVGFYAVGIVWWGGRKDRVGPGMGKKKNMGTSEQEKAGTQSQQGRHGYQQKMQVGFKGTGFSGMWAVPVVYGLIAGIEGVCAGSVIGLLYAITMSFYYDKSKMSRLGALYNAGGFKMSTWMPFVWALISLLVLIVSSFSIQGGL